MKRVGCIAILNPQMTEVIMVTRRGSHLVGFPGGKAEPNETSKEAALRELKEETGIVLAHTDTNNPILVGIQDGFQVATFLAIQDFSTLKKLQESEPDIKMQVISVNKLGDPTVSAFPGYNAMVMEKILELQMEN
jgi:8-oxo-dGTP pyrophosphatase MutT (NUDIX family)